MADTIINTPSSEDTSNVAGWVLAIVAIVAVLLAGFWWVRGMQSPGIPNTGADVNITVPSTEGGSTGGSGTLQGTVQ